MNSPEREAAAPFLLRYFSRLRFPWLFAVTALLLQEGALPVVGYRDQRGKALALQQKLQDLYGGPVSLVEGDIGDPAVRQRYFKTALLVKEEIYGIVVLPGDPARAKGSELGAALGASFAANCEAPILLAQAGDSTHGTEPRELQPRYEPVPPEPEPAYDASYIFGLTRGVTMSTMVVPVKVLLLPLSIPLDIALLPFAAIGGFF